MPGGGVPPPGFFVSSAFLLAEAPVFLLAAPPGFLLAVPPMFRAPSGPPAPSTLVAYGALIG